jgi:hypothetical protein
MRDVLIKYVRDKSRKPIGMVVAVKQEKEPFTLGWSLCNKKDKWNRDIAKKIAIGRAYNISHRDEVFTYYDVPESLHDEVHNMNVRANRYFKGD